MASSTELKSGRYFDTPQPNGRKRLYEVHFPHNYVQYHPWGITPPKDPFFELPVSKVCHVAHEKQASQILPERDDGNYHFTPHEKSGKSYNEDGRPLGESYRCILNQTPGADTFCYQYIPESETVFPGYYSWWGLATTDQQVRMPKVNLPPYLKSPPESVYGGYVFESKLCDLLRSYAFSRGCGDVYLKMGGTLRYKREIAYVVIVCTANDLGALNSYSPITHAPPDVFDPNGLVDDNGKVIDKAKVPNFITHYVDTYLSYETLSFAFYFNSPSIGFQCLSNTVEFDIIDHPFCIHTKPMATWYDQSSMTFDTKRCCPEDEKAQQTHANVTGFAMWVHGDR